MLKDCYISSESIVCYNFAGITSVKEMRIIPDPFKSEIKYIGDQLDKWIVKRLKRILMHSFVEYIPIITTIISVYFTIEIYGHYQKRKKAYLLWWTIGVITYGLGTLAESINVLYGWSEANLKYWHITGALLGGFPLAQGSVYLLLNRKFARISAIIMVTIIFIASIGVILTPVTVPASFTGRLTGSVFTWNWVRFFAPFINLYAFIFLVGGAI